MPIYDPSFNLFAVKAAVAAVVCVACSERCRGVIAKWLARATTRSAVAVFAATRLTPFAMAFLVLRLRAPGDSIEWAVFMNDPNAAWPYTSGFRELLHLVWWVMPSPLGFVALMVMAEVAAFALFMAVARRGLDTAMAGALLAFWLVNPVSLFHVALGGQDEAIVLLGWCAVAMLASRARPALAGGCMACAVLLTKFLAGFAGLPLVSRPSRQVVTGGAAFVAVLFTAAMLLAVPGDWAGFLDELRYPTSGNVWALPRLVDIDAFMRIGSVSERVVAALFAVGMLLVTFIIVTLWANPLAEDLAQTLRVTGTVGATFMLFSPKSPTAWMLMFLPGLLFLILHTPPGARRFLANVFLPVSIFEPSLWFFTDQGRALDVTQWSRALTILANIVVLSGYGLLIASGLTLRDRVLSPEMATIDSQSDSRSCGLHPNIEVG